MTDTKDSQQRPPVVTQDIQRPPAHLIEGLKGIGSATASAELSKLGLRDMYIRGPVTMTPGVSIVGPALTLQCMPRREDMIDDDEYRDPQRQLHRHVLFHTQPGDVVVVDARGDMTSGVFGEMMLTYFFGCGGIGVVVDGCIRDFTEAKKLDLGLWLRGVTPNFHTQTNIMPFAVNQPVACGDTLVMPGDIIVADDDGAVNVPVGLAEQLIATAGEHTEWEVFSRMKLAEGGDLRKYYPLREDARAEYEAWRRDQE